MFWKKKKFKIKVKGRAGIEYTESSKIADIDSEMLADGEFGLVVYLSKLEKWKSGETVTGDERQKIKENLIQSFAPTKIDWD